MNAAAFEGDYPVTQDFGGNPAAYARFGLAGHNGVDFGLPIGTPLHAPEAGVIVEDASDPTGYGNYIKEQADSGRQWLWGHRQALTGMVGQRVERGDLVGYSGNSGNSTGPHLHLGMRPPNANYANGYSGYEDPLPVLEALDALQEDDVTDQERADMQAQIDQLNGVNTELGGQVESLKWLLGLAQGERDAVAAEVEALKARDPGTLSPEDAEKVAKYERIKELVTA